MIDRAITLVRFYDRNGLGPSEFGLQVETTPDLLMLRFGESPVTRDDLARFSKHAWVLGAGLSFRRGQVFELANRLEQWLRPPVDVPAPASRNTMETVRAPGAVAAAAAASAMDGFRVKITDPTKTVRVAPLSAEAELEKLRAENAQLRDDFITVTEQATELAVRVQQLEEAARGGGAA